MSRFNLVLSLSLLCCVWPVAEVLAGVTTTGGIVLREEGGTFAPGNLSGGGSAFAFNIEAQDGGTPFPHNQPTGHGGVHTTTGVNNGIYGNSGAWLAGSVGSFVGINLGASPVEVQSIAFGRDNPGQFPDRSDGRIYTLQYTTTPNPDNMTASWTTIGTITYAGNDPLTAGIGTDHFNLNARRHRYDFAPVSATGLRIVSNVAGTGIDEFELYNSAGGPTTPMTLVEIGGSAAATGFNHAASANGGTAFAQDVIAGFPATHNIAGVNAGTYGNTGSWIGANNGRQSYVGIDFAGTDLVAISSIAFGRDNTNTIIDSRTAGNYILQYTTDPNPSSTSVWNVIDGVTYATQVAPDSLRHRYAFSEIQATGIRLQVSNNSNAIDELEAFGSLTISSAPGMSISWDGNDGDHFSAANPAPAPANLASATGATVFSDGDFGGIHTTAKLNDGLFGNTNSWISDGDATSFAGVDFAGNRIFEVTSIAFGRDNGDTTSELQYMDRSLGEYTLQFTLLNNADASTLFTGDPETGWADVGTIDYLANVDGAPGGFFTQWLRHEFELDGVFARGIRLLTPNGNAIDELEVYGTAVPEPASLALWGVLGTCLFVAARRRQRRKHAQRRTSGL